jgi:PTH2 family peptidyl-tRNA hydrolase
MANVQDRGPPSAAAIAIGSAIVAGITGYFLGQASSIGLFGKTDSRTPAARLTQREGVAKPDDAETQSDDDDGEDDDDDDDDDDSDVQDLGELQTFPGNTEECKLVLVVRSDLGKQKSIHPYSRTALTDSQE